MKSLTKLFIFASILGLTYSEARRKPKGQSLAFGNNEDESHSSIEQFGDLNAPQPKKRKEKLFSLFNVVTFKNEGCRSTSSITSSSGSQFRNGTCFTASECRARGGTESGDCAAGFGVCCVFLVSTSGGTITQNCTYIRNPNFPNTYDSSNAGQVTYMINKCDDSVCSLRLDMESFSIQGTGNTEELDTTVTPNTEGGVCLDTFDITTSSNNQNFPTICGQNSGQHVYTELGTQASDSATLTFSFSGSSTNRIWEIKVTQVPCGSSSRQPEGCFQYHTGLTGRFTTFNFDDAGDNHLRSQDYRVCIRQEQGFCCIQYMACADANSFTLDTLPDPAVSMIQTNCATKDYIGIQGSTGMACVQTGTGTFVNKFCGNFFNPANMMTMNAPVCDCTAPFAIDVFTDTLPDGGIGIANVAQSRGVCLEWMQIPCAG